MHLRLLAACLLASAARAAQMDGLLKTDSPWAFLGKFCFNPSSKEYVRDKRGRPCSRAFPVNSADQPHISPTQPHNR